MPETTRVHGLSELLKTMSELPPNIVSKGGGPVRASLRKAGVLIQKQYVQNIQAIITEPNKDGSKPEVSRTWEKSVIVSRGKPSGFKGEVFRVRLKKGARAPNGARVNTYAAVQEYGDENHRALAPFRRAFDSKKDAALSTFMSEMQKRVAAAVKKAGR